jgi:hypothetical protein
MNGTRLSPHVRGVEKSARGREAAGSKDARPVRIRRNAFGLDLSPWFRPRHKPYREKRALKGVPYSKLNVISPIPGGNIANDIGRYDGRYEERQKGDVPQSIGHNVQPRKVM